MMMKFMKKYWYKRNTRFYIENIRYQSISQFIDNLYLKPKITLIRFHSLSFVVPLAAICCTTRCHSLSLVLPHIFTRYHSLSVNVPLAVFL